MNCPQCGWLNWADAETCVNCGAPMHEPVTVIPAAPVVPPPAAAPTIPAAAVTPPHSAPAPAPAPAPGPPPAPAEPAMPAAPPTVIAQPPLAASQVGQNSHSAATVAGTEALAALGAAMPVAPAGAAGSPGAVPLLPGMPAVAARHAAPAATPAAAPARPMAGAQRPWLPVLGPADRESFFDAQRRHRRATWRMTGICALAAILTGLPLSIVLAPVIFSIVVVGTRLVSNLVAVPISVWDFYDSVAGVMAHAFAYFDDTSTETVTASEVALAAAVWLAPGTIAMLIIWPMLRELFDNAGVGATLLALGAREPRTGDLEEQQLVNVVEEMAIAAGLPAPRVMLLDTSVANAAVVGSSPRDATVIVARPLLDDLDRDETQGVLAYLIASIGNGDLGVAQSIIAVYQTFGFASAFLKAPIAGKARRTLWHMLRFTLGRRSSPTRVADAERLTRELTGGMSDVDDDFDSVNNPKHVVTQRRGPKLGWLRFIPLILVGLLLLGIFQKVDTDLLKLAAIVVLGLAAFTILYQIRFIIYMIGRFFVNLRFMIMLPYYLAVMMPQFLLMLLSGFLLQPMMALVWRTRCYLADATAVQLTRNPDWVADGLSALGRRGGLIPGGKWAEPLFVVGPEAGTGRIQSYQQARMIAGYQKRMLTAAAAHDEAAMRSAAEEAKAGYEEELARDFPELLEQQREEERLQQEGKAQESDAFGGSSGVGSFHPSLQRRLKKLRKLGAGVDPDAADAAFREFIKANAAGNKYKRFGFLLIPLVFVLLAIAAVLMVVVIALLLALSLGFAAVMMIIPYGLLEWLRP